MRTSALIDRRLVVAATAAILATATTVMFVDATQRSNTFLQASADARAAAFMEASYSIIYGWEGPEVDAAVKRSDKAFRAFQAAEAADPDDLFLNATGLVTIGLGVTAVAAVRPRRRLTNA